MSDVPFARRLDAHLAGFLSLGFTAENAPPLGDATLELELGEAVAPPTLTTHAAIEKSMVLEFAPDQNLREVLGFFGAGHTDRSVTVHTSTTVPDLPSPPRKRRRLQGKRYRIARRAYGRAVRAWRKAGRPTRTTPHIVHIPRANIAPDGPNSYSITPLPARGPSPTVAWVDEVPTFAGGSNG